MEDEYIENLRRFLKIEKYSKKEIALAYNLIRKCVPCYYLKKDIITERAILIADLERILDEMPDY